MCRYVVLQHVDQETGKDLDPENKFVGHQVSFGVLLDVCACQCADGYSVRASATRSPSSLCCCREAAAADATSPFNLRLC